MILDFDFWYYNHRIEYIDNDKTILSIATIFIYNLWYVS